MAEKSQKLVRYDQAEECIEMLKWLFYD
jgi:hypothetical protein